MKDEQPGFGEAMAAAMAQEQVVPAMTETELLGNSDPMVWAEQCADRLIVIMTGAGQATPDHKELVDFLLGWFANAMCSADPKVLINDRGGDYALRKLRRNFIDMGRRAASEIKHLRAQVEALRPKADAYDLLSKVVHHSLPGAPQAYSEDIARRIEREIEAVEAEGIKPEDPEFAEVDVARHAHEV